HRRQLNGVDLDYYDFPVCSAYLNELKQDCKILNASRWLNAALVETELSAGDIRSTNPFVQKVEELHNGGSKRADKFDFTKAKRQNPATGGSRSLPSYGHAEKQNLQIGTDCLHGQGFMGDSVIIAVLDAGWPGADTIPAFDSLHNDNRVIDTYNFLDMDTLVYHNFWHGTLVTSLMAANYPDSMVGTAPHAQYMFYTTEDVSVEVHQEEYNLILGLERADSMGAQVVSISLGYFVFDTLQGDYTYADMDGQTTICSQGIQVATANGLIVLAAAGNGGPGHIGTPCDGDSMLCVGATDTLNIIAGFSSVGPSADGRVKPDISCVGKKAAYAGTGGGFGYGNGTSFATPLSAGMVACLVQAHPNRTAQEIVQAVRESADRYNNPDTLYGYGIPNACIADSILTVLDWQDTVVAISGTGAGSSEIRLFPNPATSLIQIFSPNEPISGIEVFGLDGRRVKTIYCRPERRIRINLDGLNEGVYVLRISTATEDVFRMVSKID
ncbi:MAG: S8 family peptidase, partial [Flavobacteriales bacterium]